MVTGSKRHLDHIQSDGEILYIIICIPSSYNKTDFVT